jgi:N-acetylglucosaminyldiphosphoundecaprenol N-acetyl-beta-D-mannosaminyltransferase
VAGASLIFSLSEAAARHGLSIFLLGGEPGVADSAGRALQARFPGLVVAGTSCPPVGFEADPEVVGALVAEVAAARPDIVFCCLGFPKQERLAETLRAAMRSTWFVGCGAAVAFAAGAVPRAPRWMQRAGLEWVHRLLREPKRMFRRYIVHDLPFALLLIARCATGALRRTALAGSGPAVPEVVVDITERRVTKRRVAERRTVDLTDDTLAKRAGDRRLVDADPRSVALSSADPCSVELSVSGRIDG